VFEHRLDRIRRIDRHNSMSYIYLPFQYPKITGLQDFELDVINTSKHGLYDLFKGLFWPVSFLNRFI